MDVIITVNIMKTLQIITSFMRKLINLPQICQNRIIFPPLCIWIIIIYSSLHRVLGFCTTNCKSFKINLKAVGLPSKLNITPLSIVLFCKHQKKRNSPVSKIVLFFGRFLNIIEIIHLHLLKEENPLKLIMCSL